MPASSIGTVSFTTTSATYITYPTPTTTPPISPTPTSPPPHLYHPCTTPRLAVVMFGGYNGENALSDVWRLCLSSLQWSRSDTIMPVPLYFHSAAVTDVSLPYPTLPYPILPYPLNYTLQL